MWAHRVVAVPPTSDPLSGVLQRPEPMQVEVFVEELAVEGLSEDVLERLSWLYEAQADAGSLRPSSVSPRSANLPPASLLASSSHTASARPRR
jgi:hypothetical protein